MLLYQILEPKQYPSGILCTYGNLYTNEILFYFIFKDETKMIPVYVFLTAQGCEYRYLCKIQTHSAMRSEIIKITEFKLEDGIHGIHIEGIRTLDGNIC
jgi:hypothetical protein